MTIRATRAVPRFLVVALQQRLKRDTRRYYAWGFVGSGMFSGGLELTTHHLLWWLALILFILGACALISAGKASQRMSDSRRALRDLKEISRVHACGPECRSIDL